MRNQGAMTGLRILVVEDEELIAGIIEEALMNLGCVVVGPTGRLDMALRLATTEALDAAVLDVGIRGGAVTPVADVLGTRGVPYLLASGQSERGLSTTLRMRPRLEKPFTVDALKRWVQSLADTAGSQGDALAEVSRVA